MFYGIRGPGEAKAYLLHPVLKSRLLEISKALLELETNDPRAVMGTPDNLKLRSCMTLFEAVAEDSTVFSQVLESIITADGIEKHSECWNLNRGKVKTYKVLLAATSFFNEVGLMIFRELSRCGKTGFYCRRQQPHRFAYKKV